MEHQAELEYLTRSLQRMRLKLQKLQPEESLQDADFGLRSMLGLKAEYRAMEKAFLDWISQRTMYKLMDPFECNYIVFALPESAGGRTVVIGPYLTADRNDEAVLELTERLGLPLQYARQLMDYYAALPVFVDTSMLLSLVSTMGEVLWGGIDAFEAVDLNAETNLPPAVTASQAEMEENSLFMRMQSIQTRYDYENAMIDTVSKGLVQQVETITAGISQLYFEKRMADPLRNIKNYCIICNTLLRKAAEQGGVHPMHIDRMSSHYAMLIENKGAPEACYALIRDMFRAYCRLVRSHSISQYSAPVQKALLYMEENLSGDLSLPHLARQLSLSPGYLSGLFHRELGHTLSEHINDLRMKHARHLLQTTQLQVQNVALLCGIPDANYFTKLFKKKFHLTPRQFREGLTTM